MRPATLGAARLCGSVPREATPRVQLSVVLWQSVQYLDMINGWLPNPGFCPEVISCPPQAIALRPGVDAVLLFVAVSAEACLGIVVVCVKSGVVFCPACFWPPLPRVVGRLDKRRDLAGFVLLELGCDRGWLCGRAYI